MYALRYLQPFGISPYLHLSRSRIPFDTPFKTLMKCLKPQVYSRASNFETFYHYLRKFHNSGFDGLLDDYNLGLFSDLDSEEDRTSLLMSLRKLVVPLLLVIDLVMNWGQPIIIAVKVTLTLLTTKPIPLSVYVLVEQLRDEAIRQQSFIYKFKSLYAKKVEVADYLFLSLAKVELKDEEFTLIGILGSWWSLPISSWPILKYKILKNLS